MKSNLGICEFAPVKVHGEHTPGNEEPKQRASQNICGGRYVNAIKINMRASSCSVHPPSSFIPLTPAQRTRVVMSEIPCPAHRDKPCPECREEEDDVNGHRRHPHWPGNTSHVQQVDEQESVERHRDEGGGGVAYDAREG